MRHTWPLLILAFASTGACGGTVEGPGGTQGTGAGGSTGHGATGGTGATNGSGGATASTGKTASSGGPSCATPCGSFTCCGDTCINPYNDIQNCGGCGVACTGDHPYCDNGHCGQPQCNGPPCASSLFCCGDTCCGQGQLCCTVPGPVTITTECVDASANGGTCPTGCLDCKCAAPDTPIATPSGPRAIASLVVGDLVYSVRDGAVVVAPILAVHAQPAPNHRVVALELANGERLEMSPLHPTADGRRFGELRAGERLDGVEIVATRVVPYTSTHTHDILPDTDSGAYFAGSVLIGSTLRGR
jgi:hypothetical protein